jgi:isoleucyl-tRNA synthetase
MNEAPTDAKAAFDYKSTVNLPRTDFKMKAGLPRLEPEIMERWERLDIYRRHRDQAKGREAFILHDGPPYANGHLHIGHALNKILKDVITRSQQMLGKDSNYVPGWDCHGLPIEWKIEEKYRAEGKDKDEVPIVDFRRECREFADHWIDVQRDEFKRLGVVGDWKVPYTTMTHAAEAQIVREVGTFLINGALYRGTKPVLWSVVEKTALAEAEVEYHDHTSTTIMVRFPVLGQTPAADLHGASILIWTTTPWTIPGNRALAFSQGSEYVRLRVNDVTEESLAAVGEDLILAAALVESVTADCGIIDHEIVATFPGSTLEGAVCRHPLHGQGYDFEVPTFAAAFATVEEGTGFVHIAPGHGADDWNLGIANGIEVPETVDGDGFFVDSVPLFAGRRVLTEDGDDGDANPAVIEALGTAGALLHRMRLVHSYPHSWRSKAPLIFRNTAQWFISMQTTGLRDTALKAIDATRFVPASGRTRLYDMIETRPDWVISRQRAWGVPITIFVDKKSGEPLRDEKVVQRIVDAVEAEGTDVWFAADPARFLAPEYDPEDYEQVMDILDVWFESGSTHSFVLEHRADLEWPASLYLEGTDQHRGWFHSSLLESCGSRGRAPYDAVLTHGFVMGEDGQKMSKSVGNIISPQEVVDQHGADVLRLWVVGSDYSEDLRIGPEILKHHADIYRRLRNTLRFLLGNLTEFGPAERVEPADMPELDRWVLHRMWQLDGAVREASADFEFHSLFTELHHFCAVDLSAFYFDIRKDSLYCDRADNVRRQSARTVLDILFDRLTSWLAPIICFTAEEAWLARHPGDEESVHLRLFPDVVDAWRDDALAEKWAAIREVRGVVTGALEVARNEKTIGSSLQAAPVVYLSDDRFDRLEGVDMSEVCITSAIELRRGKAPDEAYAQPDVMGVEVVFGAADGGKCDRCWMVLEDVGSDAEYPEVCGRCADAVRHHATC